MIVVSLPFSMQTLQLGSSVAGGVDLYAAIAHWARQTLQLESTVLVVDPDDVISDWLQCLNQLSDVEVTGGLAPSIQLQS